MTNIPHGFNEIEFAERTHKAQSLMEESSLSALLLTHGTRDSLLHRFSHPFLGKPDAAMVRHYSCERRAHSGDPIHRRASDGANLDHRHSDMASARL